MVDIVAAEAGDELRNSFAGEAQRGGDHFLNFAKALVARARGGCSDHLGRFRSEQVAHGVDAIDANVLQGPTPVLCLEAMVAGRHGEGEDGGEQARLPDLAAADHVDGRDGAGLGVEPVGRHQHDARRVSRRNHRLAFGNGDGQRLLNEGMDAGLGRTDRIVGMHGIGQCDVDGVNVPAFQHLVILLVAIDVRNAIERGKLPGIGAIAGDKGRDLGITSLGNRRQEGDLRDPAGAHDGVSYLLHSSSLPLKR